MRSICAAATIGVASASLLRVNLNKNISHDILGVGADTPKFGNGKCACVGIDNIDGVTETTAGPYPADLGARCEAWDNNVHADCKGANPKPWCADKWCYVDPCKCDIDVIPKVSAYLPDAKYQGKPVYYSYATCGNKDQWTSENHEKACVNQKTKGDCNGLEKCMWSEEHNKCGGKDVMGHCDMPLVDYKWGEKQCRCIGIDGQGGKTEVMISQDPEKHMDYPADVGASCDAWDLKRHPDCQGDNKPGWCVQRWCFVDPCSCNIDVPPKGSYYLPEATFQGKPLYYSYSTCGSEDHYADEAKKQEAKIEQQKVCSSAWAATPLVGLLFAFVSM